MCFHTDAGQRTDWCGQHKYRTGIAFLPQAKSQGLIDFILTATPGGGVTVVTF